jgi:hypothetical protein
MNVHPMVTQRYNDVHRPKTYIDGTVRYNPYRRHATSHRTALSEPAWRTAMEEEFDALQRNQIWQLVPRPLGTNIVGSKWVFKTKFRSDGSIDKHKAWLVARGFTQQHGIDYHDTFSPVVKPVMSRFVWFYPLPCLVDGVFSRLTSVMPSFMVFLRKMCICSNPLVFWTPAILVMSASFSVLYMV